MKRRFYKYSRTTKQLAAAYKIRKECNDAAEVKAQLASAAADKSLGALGRLKRDVFGFIAGAAIGFGVPIGVLLLLTVLLKVIA